MQSDPERLQAATRLRELVCECGLFPSWNSSELLRLLRLILPSADQILARLAAAPEQEVMAVLRALKEEAAFSRESGKTFRSLRDRADSASWTHSMHDTLVSESQKQMRTHRDAHEALRACLQR